MKGPEECCKEEDCGPVSLATEDFAEYFWMAEEMDEFDEKCKAELWEEYFLDLCFEEMLEEEEERETQWYAEPEDVPPDWKDLRQLEREVLKNCLNVAAESTLNPLAQEFVPEEFHDVEER